MGKSKLISILLTVTVAVVVVASASYFLLKEDIAPGYLDFLPENPYLQIEFQNPKKLTEEIQGLKVFELLKEQGTNQKILDFYQKIISEATDEKLPEIKKYLGRLEKCGKVSAVLAMVEGKKQPLQFVSVAEFTAENSAETVATVFENITKEIISNIENKSQIETYTYNGHKILTIRYDQDETEEAEIKLPEVQMATVNNFILFGIGNKPLEEALQQSKTSPSAHTLFVKKTKDFKLAAKMRPGLVGAFIDLVEEKTDISDKHFSFDGFKNALAKIGAGISELQVRVHFEDNVLKATTRLDYQPDKLHPLLELVYSVRPGEHSGASYFPGKSVSYASQRLPDLDRLLTVLLDTVVEIVESSAGKDFKNQAKMFSGMFRGGIPEDDLKNILNLLGPELTFGSFFPEGSEKPGDENWLVLMELKDYDKFIEAGAVLNENEFINFSTDDNSISPAIAEIGAKLFFERDDSNLIFSLDKQLIEKAIERSNSENNLATYDRFQKARRHYPERVNDFSFYNIEAFAPVVKKIKIDDYPQLDFITEVSKFSEIKNYLVEVLKKMPPVSAATVNDAGRGVIEAKIQDPGLTFITLTMLRGLAEVKEVTQMSCDSREAKFKSDIATVRTAAVQCQMSSDCNFQKFDQSWSEFLPERFWNPEIEETWTVNIEDGQLTTIKVDDIGCEWTDRFGNSGRGMIFDNREGEFRAIKK
jgi:hypothetical protein